MPLTTDERILKLSDDLLKQFNTMFGIHPGFRAAHAKGILLEGEFTPTQEARELSIAPHFNQTLTPVWVRFSNSTGVPFINDNDPNADPRGMAVRFILGEHKHTDIVAHSTDGFPTRTGEEFLEFLRAAVATDPSKFEGSPLAAFLGSHPAALRFVQTPKPAPTSFARDTYFGVTAMRFINNANTSRYGRYRIAPLEGNEFLESEALKAKGGNYLLDEIKERVAKAPVHLNLLLQLAGESDTVDDATAHWPDTREIRNLGTLTLSKVLDNNAAEQKKIIFDPIPRVAGIEPSADPLLELRAAIYLISGRRRRSADVLESRGAVSG